MLLTGLAERAAGPFNHPTEMISTRTSTVNVPTATATPVCTASSRLAALVKSWGQPGHSQGQFHLPHSIAFDDGGKLYVADRSNSAIHIFTPDGYFLGSVDRMSLP